MGLCADRITPNKPLAVLLSHRLTPSFSLKLTAFSFRDSTECAFVTSDLSKSPNNAPVLQYLNATGGDKQLIIIKESSAANVIVKVFLL